MRSVAINGLTFDVEAAGDPGNPMVLMLHGFPQTSHSWRYQMRPLAEAGYFAVAPNQRGYSPRARPREIDDYATDNLIEDAMGLIDHFGHSRAHIVGHDWGGQLSWLIAAYHPDRVHTLTVLSRPHPRAFSKAFAEDARQAERSKHHRAFQDLDAAAGLLANDAKRLRGLFSGQQIPAEAAAAYLEVLGSEAALDAAIHWYRAAARASAGQPLGGQDTPDVNLPTLYIWGDADATVGEIAALGTAECVAGPYRFERIPGVGHFVTDEVGERVSELLLEHLTDTRE